MYIQINNDINNIDELNFYLKENNIKVPEYRPAVIALFVDNNGRILLQRRGPKSRDEVGKLEDIGGAVENGDKSFIDAMHREITEEVGNSINYTLDKLIGGCLINKYDSRTNSYVNWFFLLYKCTYIDGELLINEPGKCLGYEFYKYNELPVEEVANTTMDFWRYYYNEKDTF